MVEEEREGDCLGEIIKKIKAGRVCRPVMAIILGITLDSCIQR